MRVFAKVVSTSSVTLLVGTGGWMPWKTDVTLPSGSPETGWST